MEYYKSLLDDHDSTIYNQILSGIKNWSCSVNILHPHRKFEQVLEFIELDHPKLFFVNFRRIHYRKYSHKICYMCHYLYTKEKVERYQKQLEEWRQFFVDNQPKSMSIPQLYLWLQNCITYNIIYGNNEMVESHNVIGVVRNHVSVCGPMHICVMLSLNYSAVLFLEC